MKTAKDWMDQFENGLPHRKIDIDDLAQVQLDAWKQGMTEASAHCLTCSFLSTNPVVKETAMNIAKAIAMTRDSRTSV